MNFRQTYKSNWPFQRKWSVYRYSTWRKEKENLITFHIESQPWEHSTDNVSLRICVASFHHDQQLNRSINDEQRNIFLSSYHRTFERPWRNFPMPLNIENMINEISFKKQKMIRVVHARHDIVTPIGRKWRNKGKTRSANVTAVASDVKIS